jgi:hypothetical protein
MTFLKAADGEAEAMAQWFFETHVPDVLDAAPGLRRWQVRLKVDPPPAMPDVLRSNDTDPDIPVFDLLAESWFDSRAAFLERFAGRRAEIAADVTAHTAVAADYRVVEYEAWDFRGGATATAFHNLGLVRWREDVPEPEVRLHWEEHESNARRVHYGAVTYRRNWIEEAMTPGAPSFDGVSDLGFLTADDLAHRHFSSSRGGEEIIADIGDFVGGFQALTFGEQINLVGPGRR